MSGSRPRAEAKPSSTRWRAPQAANLGGWYYDNPTSPTEIVLCPKSCEAIGGSKGKIRIELGCTTIEIPE
jgi:hypothetical protein